MIIIARIAVLLGVLLMPITQAAERVQPSTATMDAYFSEDYATAFGLIQQELRHCEEAQPKQDECFDLLRYAASFAKFAGEPKAEENYFKQKLALSLRVLGKQHEDTASSYGSLAIKLTQQGRHVEAEPLFRNALEAYIAALGERHTETTMGHVLVANNLRAQGRTAEGEEVYLQMRQNLTSVLAESDPNTVMSLDMVAENVNSQGRNSEAELLYRQALKINRNILGEQNVATAGSYNKLAMNLNAQGRYAEAEPLLRQALETRLAMHGERHPYTATSYDNLAYNLRAQGRFAAAEPLVRQALEIRVEYYGEQNLSTANSYVSVASHLYAQGRYAEAEAMYRQALEIWVERNDDRQRRWYIAQGYANVARTLYGRGLYADAEPLYRQALEYYLEVYGESRSQTASAYGSLASNLFALGRYTEAEPLYRKALEIQQVVLGEAHPDIAWSHASLAGLLAVRPGGGAEALSHARSAVSIVRARRDDPEMEKRSTDGQEAKPLRWIYASLLHMAWLRTEELRQAATSIGDPVFSTTYLSVRDEGFAAAQDYSAGGTGAAVAQMAARFAAGDDALAEMVRQHQDLMRELTALDRSVLEAWGEGDTAKADRLNARSSELNEQFSALDESLREAFPDYAELASPSARSVTETQGLLAENDGLLLIVSLEDATHVFALTRQQASWRQVFVSASELSRRVRLLRCDVDPATCAAASGSTVRAGKSAYSEAVSQGNRPFDRQTAYQLYQDLIAPVAQLFKDVDHLYVVSAGALSSLPLSVLVTEPPGVGEDNADPEVLRGTAWFGARYALTTLPSVSSLKSLRKFAEVARTPFLGFGDPQLEGQPAVAQNEARGLEQFYRGVSESGTLLAAPAVIRQQLAPLPGTRVEIQAMADALGAPGSAVRLGEDATERAVKSADLKTRVLVFATHGLVAGELRGLGEPGLVFTPPPTASTDDDGILTASEAAQLDLNVEWLILSACNTASADGTPGADGLSGLARAFLYAGAQALLVSHWRVRDDVTATLTVRTVQNSGEMSRAHALRTAMTTIRTGVDPNGDRVSNWDPSWSHPSAWAPFVIVGGR